MGCLPEVGLNTPILRQDAPFRYCAAHRPATRPARSALPRERFSPLALPRPPATDKGWPLSAERPKLAGCCQSRLMRSRPGSKHAGGATTRAPEGAREGNAGGCYGVAFGEGEKASLAVVPAGFVFLHCEW
jgi:hypothetical protein